MKKVKTDFLIVLILILTSIILYTLQLCLFHSPRDTSFYILQDFAFLPLQVALVTVVLGKILNDRDKREKIKKISMVIETFFSEAGTEILIKLTEFAENFDMARTKLLIGSDWTDEDFLNTVKHFKKNDFLIKCTVLSLSDLKILLLQKRDFLIRMLENPNLLEHDKFTDMLLAVFHVTEELISREDFKCCDDADFLHLSNDIERALRALVIQWIYHMEYLCNDYPYLYMLEVRRNPFAKVNNSK